MYGSVNLKRRKEARSMEKINGIIEGGKVFIAEMDANCSYLKCDMIEEDGRCGYKHFCARLGVDNIFRYSPKLTERLNNPDLLNGK